MNTYDVTVLMKITKTYRVEADSEDEAIEEAHTIATPRHEEDIPEDYDQDTVNCVLVSMTDRTDQSHWDEDPEYPVADWRAEVAEDATRQSYAEWVNSQREYATDEEKS